MVPKKAKLNKETKLIGNKKHRTRIETFDFPSIDEVARSEETAGHIQVHVISNSAMQPVNDKILTWLVNLRNIISEELPDRIKSHISKEVFDPMHRSLVLVEKGDVIGGICFRMLPMQEFSEILFIAVTAKKQGQGYGTHMMNHLKDYHVSYNILMLLTFTPEETLGFFEMQGFTEIITVPESLFTRCINTYEGTRLMECKLENTFPYTKFSEVITLQRKLLKKKIDKYKSYASVR